MIRVLLVDDQELVRTGFRMVMESMAGIQVVGEASDGIKAIDEVSRLAPDVVLMDVRMPHMSGIDATARITAEPDGPKVIILTTFDLDEYVYDALKAGASGFLLKDAPPAELERAIHVVANGDALLAPSVTRRLVLELTARPRVPGAKSRRARNGALPPQLLDLTPREVEVLLEVARGLSNAQIAETLFISQTTVKSHVRAILTKLGLRDRVQAVIAAYESGLMAEDEV